MNRVSKHVLAGLAIGGGCGIAVSACAHDDSTLFIYDVEAPQYVSAGTTCSFQSDPTQPYIESGTLDLDFLTEYNPTYLVGNQLVAQSNPSALATETSFITLQKAVVRITDVEGKLLNTFTSSAAATIAPASGTTPSYAAISATTIDSQTAVTYGPKGAGSFVRFLTYVKFVGVTLGGQTIESDEFVFPVDLCRGCLIDFAQADIDPLYLAPNCASNPGVMATTTEVPCVRGQDLPVDCSQCQDVAACSPPLIPVNDAGTATD
ncbi:MAG: hypothetical protein ABSC94_21450 [Polyangiaceae bacterium]